MNSWFECDTTQHFTAPSLVQATTSLLDDGTPITSTGILLGYEPDHVTPLLKNFPKVPSWNRSPSPYVGWCKALHPVPIPFGSLTSPTPNPIHTALATLLPRTLQPGPLHMLLPLPATFSQIPLPRIFSLSLRSLLQCHLLREHPLNTLFKLQPSLPSIPSFFPCFTFSTVLSNS